MFHYNLGQGLQDKNQTCVINTFNLENMNTESVEYKETKETVDQGHEEINIQTDDKDLDKIANETLNHPQVDVKDENFMAEENGLGPDSPKKHFEKFLQELALLGEVDKKLEFGIDFMEKSIAQTGTPHFKSFWEARTICLELFKENISPQLRTVMWTKYNDLSKEARRLKDLLDEQSTFAVEQIEIAIKDLEQSIAENSPPKLPQIDFGSLNDILSEHFSEYLDWQQKLNGLNTQASRINALRKELIRTEMRVRQKNKFFQRLSAAGDSVFPLRKDLIMKISSQFMDDIDAFIAKEFKNNNGMQHLSQLREKIKSLQNVAKLLTLNTQAFTHTRMHLSECWDILKNEEKTRKKERSEQRAVLKQNFDQAFAKLQAFKEGYQSSAFSFNEAIAMVDAMGVEFCHLELDRSERHELREAFVAVRQMLLDKMQVEEKARLEKQEEKENQQRQKILELKSSLDSLIRKSESIELDILIAGRDEISNSAQALSMNKIEKVEIDRQLKVLKDRIAEKKEQSLISLSDDERNSLENLKSVLSQRKERKQSIKAQIDQYKKSNSLSGLDFEQAMNYNMHLDEERERLEKINQSIKEIEEKIAELESQ